ncbi:MAG TPA: hypothetical protein VGX50_11120 [Longimicrobium sp.]|jgi:hypothetical protein|nr:hypothetical protein [Longimicrobium sp.]
MSDQNQIQPGQNQDDELDVEELEEVAGGGGFAELDDTTNNTGCPNINCPC